MTPSMVRVQHFKHSTCKVNLNESVMYTKFANMVEEKRGRVT